LICNEINNDKKDAIEVCDKGYPVVIFMEFTSSGMLYMTGNNRFSLHNMIAVRAPADILSFSFNHVLTYRACTFSVEAEIHVMFLGLLKLLYISSLLVSNSLGKSLKYEEI
jgi:hypothetical protein